MWIFSNKSLILLLAIVGTTYSQFPLTSTNYQTPESARQESINQNGEIQGQYSYIDPNGKTITVKYTAGKNGFIVQGDHLPNAHSAGGVPQYQSVPQNIQGQYQPEFGHQSFGNFQDPLKSQGVAQSFQNFNQKPSLGFQPSFGTFGNQLKPLFTPSPLGYPAASAGQIDNYKKALEEEKAEMAKETFGQVDTGLSGFGNSFGSNLGALQNTHRFGSNLGSPLSAPLGAPQGIPQTPYNLQFGNDHGFSFEYNL